VPGASQKIVFMVPLMVTRCPLNRSGLVSNSLTDNRAAWASTKRAVRHSSSLASIARATLITFLADLFEVALQADSVDDHGVYKLGTYADHLKERPFIAQLTPASSVACVVPHAVREARTQPGAPAR